jgi:hypothetical protein
MACWSQWVTNNRGCTMSFKNAQEALIDQPSMDAMRLILWQRDLQVMTEQSEEGSDLREFLDKTIDLVQSLVRECEKYRDPDFENPALRVSDLMTMKPLFDAMLNGW